MIRREFLKKLAAGGGIAAALPAALQSRQEDKRADEESSARLASQVEELRKQISEMKRSHKLLVKAGLIALSITIGLDIATWI